MLRSIPTTKNGWHGVTLDNFLDQLVRLIAEHTDWLESQLGAGFFCNKPDAGNNHVVRIAEVSKDGVHPTGKGYKMIAEQTK